jgi:hypothetical protein
MAVTLPAMKLFAHDEKPPIEFQEILCHMVFDVKVDFKRMARYGM